MWLSFLSQWNGVNIESVSSDELCLYTDASGTIGFGGYFKGEWFSEPWPVVLSILVPNNDKDVSIAF